MLSKILFVDDDPLMHQLYRPHVERAGYGWIGASGGREALKVAAAEIPRLAVIDLHMPEVDGLSTVAELKRAEATKAMPIIVISSEPEYYVRKRDFTDAGAAVFLTKPFGPGQLLEAIGRLLPSKLHVPSEGNGFIRIGH
jgi:DNA-binding response OmpR family regulator